MVFCTKSEDETRQFAQKLAPYLRVGDVVLFRGEMGAGKTAFTKGLADYFEVTDEVSSPTFAIVHEYRGKVNLFHFDLYRITGFDDLYAIGFFDYLARDGIILVEWSENVPELETELENIVSVSLEKISENERRITVVCANCTNQL